MDNRTRVVVALADMTYPERRSFDHPNKYGYDLTYVPGLPHLCARSRRWHV